MIKKIFKISENNNKIYLLLLIIIAIVCHINWFSFSNIINFGDQVFFYKESLKELYFSFGTWLSLVDLGKSNVQLFNFPIQLISSFLSNIKSSAAFVFNITYLVPIAILGFVSPFVLSKKLINDSSISFLVALFYGSTINFLVRQNAHANIAFVEALAPLVIYYFILALEKNKKNNWIYFTLIYSLAIFYEIRLTYVLTFILLFYFIIFYAKQIKNYWKNISYCVSSVILLNIFWFFPIIAGSASERLNFIINRDLENNFQYNIINAFSIFNFVWTEYTGVELEKTYYLWAIPIIAFSTLLFLKFNKKYKKEILFFAIVSLIGIVITKQVGEPFKNLFPWLRENVPGFMMFRSVYKLYFITSLGYLGLLSFGLLILKNQKYFKYLFHTCAVLITLVSFINLLPFLQQKLDTNNTKIIQPDYLIFKEFIVNQKEFFRTLEVPRRFRWVIFTNNHPNINLDGVLFYSESLEFYKTNLALKNKNERVVDFFEKNYSNYFIDIASVKYITVPPRDLQYNRDFWEIFYSEKRQFYIDELDKQNYLKKIDIGTRELVVYENENYRPHIYTTKEAETIHWEVPFEKVDFVQKNPTEYKISLKNLSKKTYLNFSESFHPDWKLRAGGFGWFSVLFQKNYFLPDEFHLKNNANLSTFKIDPEFIKQNYPNSYTQNPDGSINVELTLYFKPQSYFYLGLIISAATLLSCLGYLLYDWRKRRKYKNEPNGKISEKIL